MVLWVHETTATTKSEAATSSILGEAKDFKRERVKEFFDFLEGIVEDNNLDTGRIYTFDETGLTTVQKKPRRAVSRKGMTKLFSVSSG